MLADLALTEVATSLFELRLPIPWEDEFVNVFLFAKGNRVDMVDCGMNSRESIELIRRAVRTVAGESARLRRLVVTHIHPDHYGGAGVLVAEDGAELYLHRLEVPMVHPRYLELEQLVHEVHSYLTVNGVAEPEARIMSNASRSLRDFVTPAAASVQLEGAETVELGGRELRVEWTAGHSPGHICLFDAEARLLLAGDQLLPDISPNIGLHPQSTPDPLDDYIRSLRRLARLEPELVLPAHGRPFADAAGRVGSLIEHHDRRKERILEIVGDRGISGWEVAVELWGVREPLHEKRLMLQEALAHLQSLACEGRLVKLATAAAISWRQPRPAS